MKLVTKMILLSIAVLSVQSTWVFSQDDETKAKPKTYQEKDFIGIWEGEVPDLGKLIYEFTKSGFLIGKVGPDSAKKTECDVYEKVTQHNVSNAQLAISCYALDMNGDLDNTKKDGFMVEFKDQDHIKLYQTEADILELTRTK